jgi:diguanylate cyclase (GGDEF)-like protein/PAS domain S-box-containing protein
MLRGMPPLPHPATRIARIAWPAVVGLYVLVAALTPPGDALHETVRTWMPPALHLLAATSCLLRSRSSGGRHALSWALLGLGIASYGCGSLLFRLSAPDPRSFDAPALSHVLWLAFYPAAYTALLRMVRTRALALRASLWIDGAIAAATVAAIGSAFVFPHLVAGVRASTIVIVSGLAYPCLDATLLVMSVWTLSLLGWRPDRTWLLLTGAMALMAVGDMVLDIQVAMGTFVAGGVVSATFPVATSLIGFAARRPPACERRSGRIDDLRVLVLPGVCVAAVLLVAAIVPSRQLPETARVCGLVALGLATVRAGLTLAEMRALYASRRFERGFEEAWLGMALISADLRWVRVNRTLCDLLAHPAAALVPRSMLDRVHPEDRTTVHRALAAVAGGRGVPATLEARLICGAGGPVQAVISATAFDDNGNTYVFAQFRDVTAARHAERQRAAIAELGRRALEDRDTEVLLDDAAELVRATLGARRAAVLGAETAAFQAFAPGALSVPILRAAGSREVLVVHGAPADGPDPAADARFLEAVATVLGGALQRRDVEEQLRRRALEDPLTGAANRAMLATHLAEAVRDAGDGGRRVIAVVLDLDRFKAINDGMGHSAGDAVIVSVADRLRGAVRAGDFVARLGGDEFVVVCVDDGPEDGADREVTRRILEAFREPFDAAGRRLGLTASIGVAIAGGSGACPEQLLSEADAAMYHAKRSAGMSLAYFDERLERRSRDRLEMELELQRAVAEDELALRYQPIVDLASGRVVAFEALLRWQHPQRGLVGPDAFVGFAEETGLIVPIGTWVLEQVCRQLAVWNAPCRAGAPIYLSANLSALQVTSELPGRLRALLAATGADPALLTLEITETLLLDGPEAAAVLDAVRRLGIGLALDDFGIGYSSLSTLRHQPVDTLKLDRSFVGALDHDRSGAPILRAAVEMGAALGLRVVAEGIETARQRDQLVAYGCPLGQGFLFSQPLPVDEADALLAREALALSRAA